MSVCLTMHFRLLQPSCVITPCNHEMQNSENNPTSELTTTVFTSQIFCDQNSHRVATHKSMHHAKRLRRARTANDAILGLETVSDERVSRSSVFWCCEAQTLLIANVHTPRDSSDTCCSIGVHQVTRQSLNRSAKGRSLFASQNSSSHTQRLHPSSP